MSLSVNAINQLSAPLDKEIRHLGLVGAIQNLEAIIAIHNAILENQQAEAASQKPEETPKTTE